MPKSPSLAGSKFSFLTTQVTNAVVFLIYEDRNFIILVLHFQMIDAQVLWKKFRQFDPQTQCCQLFNGFNFKSISIHPFQRKTLWMNYTTRFSLQMGLHFSNASHIFFHFCESYPCLFTSDSLVGTMWNFSNFFYSYFLFNDILIIDEQSFPKV